MPLGGVRAVGLALVVLAMTVPLPSDASHGDGTFDQPVWFTWHRADLNVLVIPPTQGQVYNGNGALNGGDPMELTPFNSYLDATLAAIEDWLVAVDAFGSDWLKENLELNVYVLGVDVVPEWSLANAHIIVNSSPHKGQILGVAFIGLSGKCVIDNSRFFTQSFTYNDMYSVSGHEFGHCLGQQHVNGGHPDHDILVATYPHNPGAASTHRHCMSNLNVFTMERAFGGLHGAPSGGTASVAVQDYATIPC